MRGGEGGKKVRQRLKDAKHLQDKSKKLGPKILLPKLNEKATELSWGKQ